MDFVVNTLMGLDGWVLYALVALLVFAEDALFFGFVFPGETAVVIGGVLAHEGRISLPWLLLIVVLAAIGGDSVGYEVGRTAGPRLLRSRLLRRHRSAVERAQDLIKRRGALAVFFGRFIALFRALMPALAGSSRMPYPRFLTFNAVGGVVWGVGYTLVGFLAGAAYKEVQHLIGTGAAIAVAVIVVVVVIVWTVRRRRRERDGTDQ